MINFRMNQELDKLKDDNSYIHQQIVECQRKLQDLEMKIGFDFSSNPQDLYVHKGTM